MFFALLPLFLTVLQYVLAPQWERTLSTACNAAPWPPTPAADNDQVIVILLASLRDGPGQSAPLRCLPR